MSDFWDQVEEYAKNAPEAGYGPNVNYGLHEIVPMAVKFNGKGNAPTKTPLTGAIPEGCVLELQYTIKISELNPELEFDYQRNVSVRKSRVDAKTNTVTDPTDWSEVVLPSFIKVFGKDWAKKIGQPFYAASEHFPSVEFKAGTDKNGEPKKNYGVPSLLAVYTDKAACVAARDARYAKRDVSTGDVVLAPAAGNVPETIIAQVKGLIASIGKEQAEKALAGHPFGKQYDASMLMELASK